MEQIVISKRAIVIGERSFTIDDRVSLIQVEEINQMGTARYLQKCAKWNAEAYASARRMVLIDADSFFHQPVPRDVRFVAAKGVVNVPYNLFLKYLFRYSARIGYLKNQRPPHEVIDRIAREINTLNNPTLVGLAALPKYKDADFLGIRLLASSDYQIRKE